MISYLNGSLCTVPVASKALSLLISRKSRDSSAFARIRASKKVIACLVRMSCARVSCEAVSGISTTPRLSSSDLMMDSINEISLGCLACDRRSQAISRNAPVQTSRFAYLRRIASAALCFGSLALRARRNSDSTTGILARYLLPRV